MLSTICTQNVQKIFIILNKYSIIYVIYLYLSNIKIDMKFSYSLFLLFFSTVLFAQNEAWKGYFSYNTIRAISASESKTYFATENALFSVNENVSEKDIYNTINGFQLNDITNLIYSETYKKLVATSLSGRIVIVDEATGTISNLNDIYNKQSLSGAEKQINNIAIAAGYAYLATGYGITAIRLNDNNFGDSYYIGDNGASVKVTSVAVIGNRIYANIEGVGIKSASLNTNLIDYTNWTFYNTENWLDIINFQDQLVGVKEDLSIHRINATETVSFGQVFENFIRLSVFKNNLTATSTYNSLSYDQNFNTVFTYGTSANAKDYNASLLKNGQLYAGTSMDGAFKIAVSNADSPIYISPKGPLSNNVFRAFYNEKTKDLWAIFGGYTLEYNPYNPDLSRYGISRQKENGDWQLIPYSKIEPFESTSHLSFHPTNNNKIYVSSFNSGLLEINLNNSDIANSEFIHYNQNNTGSDGLEQYAPDVNSVRINGPVFDRQGTAWLTNTGRPTKHLKSFNKNNQWKSYDLRGYLSNSQQLDNFTIPVIDKNNTKWIGTSYSGIIAFNETRNNKIVKIDRNSNLPSPAVFSVALDNNNQLWIGTGAGLRVLASTDQFLTASNLTPSSIIIMDDGKAQELFYQQTILKIKVDGSNNKWVSVADAGVFLVSGDGQKTIYRFDTSNSPLPSNNIMDIEINDTTGEVFFVSDKGMVSYKNYATSPTDNLDDVYVYPNPVRPDFTGEVKISGLKVKSNIKITDVSGNLVYETTSDGGTALWNTFNFNGRKVASGVYMIFVSSEDGSEKTTKKLMIIR